MTDPLVITIPGTPDACLTPNRVRSERHWGPRHRATKAAREAACLAAKAAGAHRRTWSPPLTLHAVIAWEKVRSPRYPNGRYRRTLDPDAAVGILKATVDGIADALLIDDKHITLATVHQERDPDGVGYVRIAIEPQEATA